MTEAKSRVLVVDDDAAMLRAVSRALASERLDVTTAANGADALRQIGEGKIDVVVSDISMPEMDGVALLREVRRRDADLPVILLTGTPTLDSAMRAMELTAFRYMQKPVANDLLRAAVDEAIRMRKLARVHVDSERPPGTVRGLSDRPTLQAAFGRAIDTLTMVYQPLVDARSRETMGHEALMRTREPALPHPGAVLEAAEKLGGLHLLGRTNRANVASTMSSSPAGGAIFVNLHSADLADAELYEPDAPLTAFASRVVLEITERASLEGLPDVSARVARLRDFGFRIAIDDLGAGYAGLNYFASLRPDIVKIDMSLTRGLDTDPVRARLVRSVVDLSKGLGILVVAEGVETVGERDALVGIGCDYLQGYLLARPGPAFPTAVWG